MWDSVRLSLEGAWQLLQDGLLLGAGLPIVFALGVRLWAGTDDADGADGAVTAGPSLLSKAVAIVCFALVLFAVFVGIEIIVAAGLHKEVSFEYGFPTLVDKE